MVEDEGCLSCNGPLDPARRVQAVYCSERCRRKAARRRQLVAYDIKRMRTCPGCGQRFDPGTHGNRLHCSPECRKRCLEVTRRWGRSTVARKPAAVREALMASINPVENYQPKAEPESRMAAASAD